MQNENPEELDHTHKAVLTVYSNGPAKMVSIKIHWEPEMDGNEIVRLGYLPASYEFIQDYVLPIIEKAYMDWEVKPLLDLPSPSKWKN